MELRPVHTKKQHFWQLLSLFTKKKGSQTVFTSFQKDVEVFVCAMVLSSNAEYSSSEAQESVLDSSSAVHGHLAKCSYHKRHQVTIVLIATLSCNFFYFFFEFHDINLQLFTRETQLQDLNSFLTFSPQNSQFWLEKFTILRKSFFFFFSAFDIITRTY